MASRKSKRLAEKEARAAVVREAVISDPDLRDHILHLAIFTQPFHAVKDFALEGPNLTQLKMYGRLATVCKTWSTAIRGKPDIMRKILATPACNSLAEVRAAAFAPAHLFLSLPAPVAPKSRGIPSHHRHLT
jgi:hypothetical protein